MAHAVKNNDLRPPAAVPVIPAVSIVGATATGKSDLAIGLAQRLNGEIINADAMQFYRGMDIGTAKVPLQERGNVPHHLLDILDVTQTASVQDFQAQARALITQIRSRGRVPILVGGSGLYVRAATDVMTFPGTDPQLRARLERIAAAEGNASLHALLGELDEEAAAKIAVADTRRIVRALEVIGLTGDTFTAHLPAHTAWTPTVQIGVREDRDVLRSRIDRRVRSMWEDGWVDEVVRLRDVGIERGKTAAAAIGYSQILLHLRGELTAQQAQESTIVRTQQFAKRQDTWFRRDSRIHWLPSGAPDLLERAAGICRAAGISD